MEVIGVGITADDGTGDPLRTAFSKCNSNFAELLSVITDTPIEGLEINFDDMTRILGSMPDTTANYDDLEDAVSTIGITPKTLWIPSDQTVSDDLTIPSTLQIVPLNGAKITIASGKTLTINSPFTAGSYQVFTGSGAVAGLKEARPEWWGTGTDALNKAIATGAEVILQQGNYTLGAAATLGTGQVIRGAGKTVTTIVKGFNGDAITMGEGVGLVDLTLDGEGATYTGRNIVISGTDGRQYGRDCRIIDSDGYAIEYTASTAGSQDSWTGCHIARYNGTGTGRYAVKISDTAAASAVPHKYTNIETDGGLFMDLGGCDGVFVSNSYTSGYLFTSNSRSVHIANTRIRGEVGSTLEVKGSGHTIVGCTIYPEVILASGTNSNKLEANAYNNGVTDNAGLTTNTFDTPTLSYTPTLTTTGTAFELGNGTLTGSYSHVGTKWIANITLTFGSTTVPGTGIYYFSAPTTVIQQRKYTVARLLDSSAALTAPGRVVWVAGLGFRVQYDSFISVASPVTAVGGGTLQGTTPWAWAEGDVININLEYND